MAMIVRLEDGRGVYGQSGSMSEMLCLIAVEIDEAHARLRRWLPDKATRPNPFADLDIAGLDAADRAAFWSAAERAHANKASMAPGSADRLSRLMEMHEGVVAGRPPLSCSDFDHVLPPQGAADLDEIWSDGAAARLS